MGEVEVLDSKVLELRNKVKVLEGESKKLFTENMTMSNDNNVLKKKNRGEADKLSKLQTESKTVIRRMAAQKSVLEETRQKVVKAEGGLQVKWAEIDTAKETNISDEVSLKNRETSLKQDRVKLSDEKRTFQRRKEGHDINVDNFEKEKRDFSVEKVEHRLVVVDNEKKSDEIAERLAIIKNTEKIQEDREKESKEELAKISSRECGLDRRENDIDEREKNLEAKEKSVADDKEEYAKKSSGLDRRSNDIDVREAASKTKELRVTKLIRDKGIKEELERLEKSLKQ